MSMRWTKKLKIGCKGQALIEAAIILPVLLLIFFGMYQFMQFFLTKQKAHMAVRYVVWSKNRGVDVTDTDTKNVERLKDNIKELFFEEGDDVWVDDFPQNVDVPSVDRLLNKGGVQGILAMAVSKLTGMVTIRKKVICNVEVVPFLRKVFSPTVAIEGRCSMVKK